MYVLRNALRKNRSMKFNGLLTLLLMTNTVVAAPKLEKGFGATGDVVFTVTTNRVHSPCTTSSGPITLTLS
jgi:hypothetical protein